MHDHVIFEQTSCGVCGPDAGDTVHVSSSLRAIADSAIRTLPECRPVEGTALDSGDEPPVQGQFASPGRSEQRNRPGLWLIYEHEEGWYWCFRPYEVMGPGDRVAKTHQRIEWVMTQHIIRKMRGLNGDNQVIFPEFGYQLGCTEPLSTPEFEQIWKQIQQDPTPFMMLQALTN